MADIEGFDKNRIHITAFFGPHSSGADAEKFRPLMQNADVFVPEMMGWKRSTVQAFQRVSNGRMSPVDALASAGMTSRDRDFYYFALQELKILEGTKKPVAVIDIPNRSRIQRNYQFAEFHSHLLGLQLREEDQVDDTGFRHLLGLVRSEAEIRAVAQTARDQKMIDRFPAAISGVLKRFPKLQEKPELEILSIMGTSHRFQYQAFKDAGYNVDRVFSTNVPVSTPSSEAMLRAMHGKEIDDTLAAKVLAGHILREDLGVAIYEGRLSSDEIHSAEAILLSQLNFDDIYNLFTHNPYEQTYLQRLQELVGAKGFFIPASGMGVTRLLNDYRRGIRNHVYTLRDASTPPTAFEPDPVRIRLKNQSLYLGNPVKFGITGAESDCVLTDIAPGTQENEVPLHIEIPEDSTELVGRSHNPAGFDLDNYVSRRHFEITRNKSELQIRDLNSTNGTVVHSRRIVKPVNGIYKI